MGEKNNKNDNAKESKNVTVVLKTDLHCEGCASKIVKCLRSFDDVETVSIDESAKITVVGKVDPMKVKEKLEQKTHKKVELISPQPKKEKGKDNNNNNNKSNDKEEDKENAKANNNSNKKQKQGNNKNEGNDKNVKVSDEKKGKAKEPPVTTTVFKVYLHCQGCIQKIHKLVSKAKGYEDVKIDKQKDLVTVSGAMDMKALAEVLKKHLKREIEIVPPKKEEKKENGEKGKDGGKEKAGGDGNGKGKGNGGKEKGNGGNGGGGEPTEGNENQMQVRYSYPNPLVYGSGLVVEPQVYYNPYPVGGFNAPHMFSDENPNACNVM